MKDLDPKTTFYQQNLQPASIVHFSYLDIKPNEYILPEFIKTAQDYPCDLSFESQDNQQEDDSNDTEPDNIEPYFKPQEMPKEKPKKGYPKWFKP